jgi:hypothetical protein
MRTYSEVPQFSSYFLEGSFVLGIAASPGILTFDLEIALTPEHPQCTPAHPGRQQCYRRGRLRFSGVSGLTWDKQGLMPAKSTDGIDYGCIDSWSIDEDRHLINGDFGTISVVAESADISLD